MGLKPRFNFLFFHMEPFFYIHVLLQYEINEKINPLKSMKIIPTISPFFIDGNLAMKHIVNRA
jgi:hypothetical protein